MVREVVSLFEFSTKLWSKRQLQAYPSIDANHSNLLCDPLKTIENLL